MAFGSEEAKSNTIVQEAIIEVATHEDTETAKEGETCLTDGMSILSVADNHEPTESQVPEQPIDKQGEAQQEEDYCKVCIEWFYYLADTTKDETQWLKVPPMLEAITNGCKYCTFVHKCSITLFPDIFSNKELALNIQTKFGKLFIILYGGEIKPSITLEVFSTGYGDIELEVPLMHVKLEDIADNRSEIGEYDIDRLYNPPIDIAVRPVLPEGTDSDQTLATVRKWINECDEGHEDTCGFRKSSLSQTPKRILHITEDKIKWEDYTMILRQKIARSMSVSAIAGVPRKLQPRHR
jgi:hypothetical protein